MWIKLHLYQSGDETIVQIQNICAIYPDQRKLYNGITCVQFIGSEENYIQVRETVDEIVEKMTE